MSREQNILSRYLPEDHKLSISKKQPNKKLQPQQQQIFAIPKQLNSSKFIQPHTDQIKNSIDFSKSSKSIKPINQNINLGISSNQQVQNFTTVQPDKTENTNNKNRSIEQSLVNIELDRIADKRYMHYVELNDSPIQQESSSYTSYSSYSSNVSQASDRRYDPQYIDDALKNGLISQLRQESIISRSQRPPIIVAESQIVFQNDQKKGKEQQQRKNQQQQRPLEIVQSAINIIISKPKIRQQIKQIQNKQEQIGKANIQTVSPKTIQNYLYYSEGYKQQSSKMVDKLQKIAQLKKKQKSINKQIIRLTQQNKNSKEIQFTNLQNKQGGQRFQKQKSPIISKKQGSKQQIQKDLSQINKIIHKLQRTYKTQQSSSDKSSHKFQQMVSKALSLQKNHIHQQNFAFGNCKIENKYYFKNSEGEIFQKRQYFERQCGHKQQQQQKEQKKKNLFKQQRHDDENKRKSEERNMNQKKIEVQHKKGCDIQLNQSIQSQSQKINIPPIQQLQKPQKSTSKRKLPPKPKSKQCPIHKQQNQQKIIVHSKQHEYNQHKIMFPKINYFLTKKSPDKDIIKFGQLLCQKLFDINFDRNQKMNTQKLIKLNKITKYKECIQFSLLNQQNQHFVYYFEGKKIYFGKCRVRNQMIQKHGFGYYFSPHKYLYRGQFLFDKEHGKGTINYINGDTYHGQWINGKKEGQGVFINYVGDIYKGQYKNGKKDGFGQQRLKNGDLYRGEFRQGKLSGHGTYWWINGSVYLGSFKNGQMHGKGIWKSKQNDYYEGQYQNNKKCGKGIYKWSNGMIFTGTFKEGSQITRKPTNLQVRTVRKSSKSGDKNNKSIQKKKKTALNKFYKQ